MDAHQAQLLESSTHPPSAGHVSVAAVEDDDDGDDDDDDDVEVLGHLPGQQDFLQ
jgi:hypothetical protein